MNVNYSCLILLFDAVNIIYISLNSHYFSCYTKLIFGHSLLFSKEVLYRNVLQQFSCVLGYSRFLYKEIQYFLFFFFLQNILNI